MSVLAKTMRIDRTTLNRNLKPLLKAGLVTVKAGEDSRSRQAMLTEAGHDALVNALVLWDRAQASLEDYLGKAELASLEKSLSKLEVLLL